MNRAGRTVYPILLMVCATHLLNDMMQSVIPAVYPLLKEKFGFTFAQIGLITLVFQLTSSLLQPVAGRLADLHPRPYSLAAGMCFTLCGLLALAAAPGFALILVSVGLIGCGSSVFHPESSRVAQLASGGRKGLAQSIFQVGGNAGSAMGPLLAALIVIQRHKGVGDDEQQNGGETPKHRIQIFKPRKSSKLFDMISSRQRKYALVTGASSGIGREYAAQLAAKGYDLVMAGNRDEENRAAAREIAARYGVRTLPLCMDLSEPDAAVKLHAETSARGIEIGVLVCNAGVLLFGPLAAAPPERIGRIVTLHCTTPALLCRLYGEEMRRRGEGYILVMSSATAWMPYPTIAAYAATKSFLRTFARSLNFEFRKYGVRVTGVFPGAVDTPLYDLDAACRRRLLRWGVMSAPQGVAQHGLRALFRGRSSCIPGVFTKICVCVCRLVPAWLMRCVLRIPAVARLF